MGRVGKDNRNSEANQTHNFFFQRRVRFDKAHVPRKDLNTKDETTYPTKGTSTKRPSTNRFSTKGPRPIRSSIMCGRSHSKVSLFSEGPHTETTKQELQENQNQIVRNLTSRGESSRLFITQLHPSASPASVRACVRAVM